MDKRYGIVFIGHVCLDEIVPFEGPAHTAPGSAVLCGAAAASRVGCPVAVITRCAPGDETALAPLRALGVPVTALPAPATTFMRVMHPTADVDVRRMIQPRSAGPFVPEEIPAFDADFCHLAGISDQEFTLPFVAAMRGRGGALSADMQSFVRQVDPRTREIAFADAPAKTELLPLLDRVKLDGVEAALLTGERDLELAARRLEAWGCPEVMITQRDGVLLRTGGRTLYVPFTNRSIVGRTGRGDTTFAGYLAWRRAHPADEALRFAAALVSLKMETPGPFGGDLAAVLARMG